jgi:hypothetical protein
MQGQLIIGLNTEADLHEATRGFFLCQRPELSDQNLTEKRGPVNRHRINDETN